MKKNKKTNKPEAIGSTGSLSAFVNLHSCTLRGTGDREHHTRSFRTVEYHRLSQPDSNWMSAIFMVRLPIDLENNHESVTRRSVEALLLNAQTAKDERPLTPPPRN